MTTETAVNHHATATTHSGLFIYAFVQSPRELDACLQSCSGVNEQPLELVQVGDVGCLVSSFADSRIRPKRAHVKAHQDVLKALLGRTPMLPASFGVIAESSDRLESVVGANTDSILENLERIGSNVEYSLSLLRDTDNLPQLVLSESPALLAYRDALLAKQSVTHETMLEIGQRIEKAIQDLRANQTQRICDHMSGLVEAIETLPVRNDSGIAQLAFLVDPDRQQEFEERINDLATLFDESYAIRFNGPWPAYSFANVQLSLNEGGDA